MVTTTGVPSAGGGESRTVTVHGAAAGFAQEITVGKHRLSGDEPISDGGTDTGPNPYDLLCPVHRTLTSEIDIQTRLT